MTPAGWSRSRATVASRRSGRFVAAIGASGCTHAEATRTESLPDWLGRVKIVLT